MPEEEAKQKLKNDLGLHTLRFLKAKQQEGKYNDPYLQHMIEQWERKTSQQENLKMSAETKQNYLELLESQRRFLAQLNKDSSIDEEIIRHQTYQIDLEEERIKLL